MGDKEEIKEDMKEPLPSTSKEYDGKYRLSRSLSCSKVESETAKPKEDPRSNSKKRKNPPSPPVVSVKDQKAKFEDIQEKHKKKFQERHQKDLTKDKSKFKRNCKNTLKETIEDPIAKMLKKMMADLSEIKSDVKTNNNKIDDLSNKVEDLESKHKTSEERNQNQFKEIRQEIANVEVNVTTKLMTEITPSLENMRTELQT